MAIKKKGKIGIPPEDVVPRKRKKTPQERELEPSQAKGVSGPSKPKADPEKEFLSLALERFKVASEAEMSMRKEALEDLEFSIGKQWDPDVQTQRQMDKRPCLTMNRLPQFVRIVANAQRQQRPGIQVDPIGDKSDRKTAEALSGMVRHIEVNSDAEVAYNTAFESKLRGGFGYFRVITEYADPESDSFEQEIRIARIKNPFTVYFDPYCAKHDYSDAGWCFIIQDLSPEEYKSKYPNSKVASLTNFVSIGDTPANWITKETIRVAEYFYVEYEDKQIAQGEDGTSVDASTLEEGHGLPVRTKRIPHVKWALINAMETLEKQDWPGRYIPVVVDLGDDLDVDGKRHVAGLIRNGKDPQRQYNFMQSAATEMIALGPKAPYMMAEGQDEGLESMWSMINVRNFPALKYKPVALNGQLAPPPMRQHVEPPILAMTGMIHQADQDLKATMGIYDATLGQQGPEQSGRAIGQRKEQGDLATLNFSENHARAIRHCGRIILDLIPHIYDTPRIQRIINPDRSTEQVGLYNSKMLQNGESGAPPTPEELMMQLGVQKIFDVGVGVYDVAISVGPTFQTKRQEAVASIMSLVNSYPEIMKVAGDLLIGNMDFPQADEMAKRLKKTLPPELLDNGDQNPESMVIQLQAQLKMALGQHEILVKALNDATKVITTKKMDLESKERIAGMTNLVTLLTAEAKIRGEAALVQLQAQIDVISQRLLQLHENEPISVGSGDSAGSLPPSSPSPDASAGAVS